MKRIKLIPVEKPEQKPRMILLRDKEEAMAAMRGRELGDLDVPFGMPIGNQVYAEKHEIDPYRTSPHTTH